MPSARRNLPKLPSLLDRKLYKTGQTRGADDDEIFQNRVSRNSTALIPYSVWNLYRAEAQATFEKGYIVLIPPDEYFRHADADHFLSEAGLKLGDNALLFYETRSQWNAHNPDTLGWAPGESRLPPLRGTYVARIPATTALADAGRIVRGFNTTANKGAGIRVYEYANNKTVVECRFQLEALYWLCEDSDRVAAENGMEGEAAANRRTEILKVCGDLGLLDLSQLEAARVLNSIGRPTCPLCLEEISSRGFFSRLEQAEGRQVLDLTVTQINLFHVEELRMGLYNHRPYNIGWGHHHCNVVARDAGVGPTLEWMKSVLERNDTAGYVSRTNKGA